MNSIAIPSPRFSWRRVAMVARYYYPSIRQFLIVIPIVTAGIGIGLFWTQRDSMGFFTLLTFFMNLTLGMSVFFGAGIFTTHSRDLDITLPALWSEKAVYLLGMTFLILPLIIYVPYILTTMLCHLIFAPSEFSIGFADYGISICGEDLGLDSLSCLIPMSTCAFVVFRSIRSTFAKSVLWTILSLILIGIATSIYFIYILLQFSTNELEKIQGPEGGVYLAERLDVSAAAWSATAVILLYFFTMVFLTCRALRRAQD